MASRSIGVSTALSGIQDGAAALGREGCGSGEAVDGSLGTDLG